MASLLNGFGSLAAGLADLSKNSAGDAQARAAPEAAPEAPQAAPAAPAATPIAPPVATGPPAASPAAVSATPSGGATPAGVPAALLPIYQSAARRTGIPVALLVAQGKQESGFRSDAVGSAGEIGIMQVKPSTAERPGFGMTGIDPATLKDPSVNINFAANYLRARAGPGADFAHPGTVNAALASYNGGGDPSYVQNVRSHMAGF